MYFIIIAVLVVFLMFLLKTFKYRKKDPLPGELVSFKLTEEIKEKLKKAIRIKTITNSDYSLNDIKEFKKIPNFINENYPLVIEKLEMCSLNDYSYIFKWSGTDQILKPILLIAHFDVVPVVEKNWSVPPFEGVEKDGFIWGRGALDTKNTFTGILESAQLLLGENFTPERTIYMAFGGDEETMGSEGAGKINEYFKSINIDFEWVLDEGGIVAEDSLSMVKNPLALIGISEKGYTNIRISSEAHGGHSSMPPEHTAAGLVARAVTKIENHPFPAKITPTISAFLYGITPHVSFPIAIVLANHKIFTPVIKKLLLQSDTTAALLRTTQAVTILSSGQKENVLPSSGEAIINMRILPGETVSSVLQRVRNLLKKNQVKVEIADSGDSNDPIRESSLSSEGYTVIQSVIEQTFPGSITVPYMMTGATDSKHYKEICKDIYRFAPMSLNSREIGLIHSADERISLENYGKTITFYKELMKKI
ncbi:MAG: M20/M25/M40 family metallo-hydrolase [Spirochaetaceae bacterium]|jgi:carboxypeptidase PM20D1|nr:M20/M25/M40 family metallo-hydrolase [Spirochaetaceae bacterium]